jgi:hypothetical protein
VKADNGEYAPTNQAVTLTVAARPTLRIADANVIEGNSGTKPLTFTVKLSKTWPQPVTVHWTTANGSATAPRDYLANNGTLTFAAGQTSKTVTVQVKGDTLDEPNRVFYVLLSGATNATIADPNASGGIVDND